MSPEDHDLDDIKSGEPGGDTPDPQSQAELDALEKEREQQAKIRQARDVAGLKPTERAQFYSSEFESLLRKSLTNSETHVAWLKEQLAQYQRHNESLQNEVKRYYHLKGQGSVHRRLGRITGLLVIVGSCLISDVAGMRETSLAAYSVGWGLVLVGGVSSLFLPWADND